MSDSQTNDNDFSMVVQTLSTPGKHLNQKVLNRLSDLSNNDLSTFRQTWNTLEGARKVQVLRALKNEIGKDTMVSYDAIGELALFDPLDDVKLLAIQLLEENKSVNVAETILDIAMNYPSALVREAAIAGLGQFVYFGEVDEIPPELHHRIESSLFQVLTDRSHPLPAQMRALESLGYSSNSAISEQIHQALQSDLQAWKAAALTAIGRSADDSWNQTVLQHIQSDDVLITLPAIRAAGELEIAQARQPLLKILKDPSADEGERLAAIRALSQIGGSNVQAALEKRMGRATDPEEIRVLEEALENLELTEGFNPLGMTQFDDAEPDEWEENEIAEEILRTEQEDDEDEIDSSLRDLEDRLIDRDEN